MNQYPGPSRTGFWIGLGALLVATSLLATLAPAAAAQGASGSGERELGLFEQVYRFVQRNYVDEIDPDVLIEGALRGMLESLDDPHSAYLDTEAMRRMTDTTSGEFGGVGMYISKPEGQDEDAYIEIVSPIEDTPAFRAGLRAGDRIVTIEGESTAALTVDEAVDLLRGRPGSDVNVMIRRGPDIEFPVALERAIIRVPTVKWAMIDDRIGLIRVIEFTPFTDDRVREAIAEFERDDYEALVIDVRSNPGGLLSAAIDVADLFLDGGMVVETRGRVDSENRVFNADPGTVVDPSIEIIVLVDSGSASASEILAAALSDRGRATLVGETTYGKGSVQQVRTIGDAGFRLTMSRYFTPSGLNIDEVGVPPDIVVQEPELSEDERASYARLREENRIRDFVMEVGEPSEAQFATFRDSLRSDGFSLNDRYLRRLIRIEVNRVLNRSEVFDLEYDIQLQRAVEELSVENS